MNLIHVGPGDECFVPRSRYDDDPDRRIIPRLGEGSLKLPDGGTIEGVVDLRTIDGDGGDAILRLIQ